MFLRKESDILGLPMRFCMLFVALFCLSIIFLSRHLIKNDISYDKNENEDDKRLIQQYTITSENGGLFYLVAAMVCIWGFLLSLIAVVISFVLKRGIIF